MSTDPTPPSEPVCMNCGWRLHRYRDLLLCQECEDQLTPSAPADSAPSVPEVPHA